MRINIKHILIFSLILVQFACNDDYLDRQPLDAPSAETFLGNETELEMAVTGVYNTLWFHPPGVDMPFPMSLEYATDNGWDRNGSDLQALGRGDANSDNSFTASYWTTMYRGIGRANYIISNSAPLIEEMEPEKYDRLLSEVRFLRIYFYSYLTELFGDVPLMIEETKLEDAEIARTPKSEVVDFMLAELDAIAPHLLMDPQSKGRVTLGAVLALKSRIALYNERWKTAAQAAEELILDGGYGLHDHFGDLFLYAGEHSQESIMSIQYQDGLMSHSNARMFYSRMALGHSNKKPPQDLVDTYNAIDGLPIDESPLYDPQSPFENRDPRLDFTVVLPNTPFITHVFNTNPDSTLTWNIRETPWERVENTEASHAYSSFTGYLWRKSADPLDYPEINNSGIDIIIFRYAEVLLNFAEAKVELNELDQSVYDAINKVRTRPSVEMPEIALGKSQEELRNLIRRERRHEFAGEGFRFFDIRRWEIAHELMPGPVLGRIPTGYLSEAPEIDEIGTPSYDNVSNADQMDIIEQRTFNSSRDYLWPIPRIELETNPLLEQNPGY